ncbi:hypothetical protein SR1949_21370 [Sphaerospermopsis reniformis]|uniref:Uncharacterized protein n=1 Tax=Sphaerospermopsis reniformis TaxID=531300 RepID=A0A479ZW87_9CYAN|nr:hypothetical protein [Sphaerospermopsis reniformis]GCL37030.1 hypothetical protein SR1949_21370 [Sphaerospermopsis reniformis]
MSNISIQEQTTYKRISAIVENLIANNSVYQERLEREQMIEKMYELFTRPNLGDDVETIADDDLTARISKILALEAISGLLNDLTPEEMAIFDEAVKRK